MDDRTGSDKTDSRNDLRRNPRMISGMLTGKLIRKQRVHGRADTDKNVRTQSSRAVLCLPLKADQSTEQGRNQQSKQI